MLLIGRRWALLESPSRPGPRSTSPQRSPASISFPSFSGAASLPPPGRRPQSGFSVPQVVRPPQRGGRCRVSAPHAPSSPQVPEAGAPGGIAALGEERFLGAPLSGALRQGSFPAPAASPSLPSPEPGLAEAASEGARARRHAPAARAQTAAAAASAAMAERRAFAQKISR